MANIAYTAKLNGTKNFTLLDGSTQRWNDGYIDFLGLWEPVKADNTTGTLRLKGTDWGIDAVRSHSTLDKLIVTDVDDGADRYIKYLKLAQNSEVTLISTKVHYIAGFEGELHDLTLGAASVYSIDLYAAVNLVTTGTGHVRSIDLGGRDTVVVNSGGVGQVNTGNRADKIVLRDGGSNGIVQSGNGNDVVKVQGGAWVSSVLLDDGNDRFTMTAADAQSVELGTGDDTAVLASGSHAFFLFSGSGGTTVVVKSGSRLNSLELGNGNHVVDIRGNSQIQHMKFYDSNVTVTTGSGWTEGIEAGGNNVVDLTVGSGGASTVRLGDGDDNVDASGGHIQTLDTGDGDDSVTVGANGANVIKTGSGADTVTLIEGWVEFISTSNGSDTVELHGNADTLSTGDGSDTVTITGIANRVSLGNGNDTVTTGAQYIEVLEAWGGNDTFKIGSGGAGSVRTGDGNDSVTTGSGYVELISAYMGKNTFFIGSGGGATVRGGQENDTITTSTGWVETISTNQGNDTVYLGSGSASSVRLGGGDDTLVLAESPEAGGRFDGGAGSDTLDFSAWSLGITFTLDATGWQNPAAPGGVLNDTANNLSYVLEGGFENVIGTDQDDDITGDNNDNTFTGNAGADVFTFTATTWDPSLTAGTDTVTDFEDGTDLLRLAVQSGGTAALLAAVNDDGTDITITHDDGVIVLANASGATITAEDFLFI